MLVSPRHCLENNIKINLQFIGQELEIFLAGRFTTIYVSYKGLPCWLMYN